MSGGSMQYLYRRLLDAEFLVDTPERVAFRRHLDLVAHALKDIEWVDSGDYAAGDESEAIRACLSDGAVLEAAIERAHAAHRDLTAELEKACRGRP